MFQYIFMINQEVNIKNKKFTYINEKLGKKAPLVILKGYKTQQLMINIDVSQ